MSQPLPPLLQHDSIDDLTPFGSLPKDLNPLYEKALVEELNHVENGWQEDFDISLGDFDTQKEGGRAETPSL